MTYASPSWEIHARDGQILGRLEVIGPDMPWFECKFTPTHEWGAVAPLFHDELELLDRDDMAAWERAYQRIQNLGLVLRATDGTAVVSEFLLHVDGENARLRY